MAKIMIQCARATGMKSHVVNKLVDAAELETERKSLHDKYFPSAEHIFLTYEERED